MDSDLTALVERVEGFDQWLRDGGNEDVADLLRDLLAALLAQRAQPPVVITPSAAAGIADLMGGDSGALRVEVTRHELTDLCLSGQAYTLDGTVNLLDETGGMARELMEAWQQREAQPAPSPWQQLTQDEQDSIHDGLVSIEDESIRDAELWAGRGREDRYRREAATVRALIDKLFPSPPKENP